MQWEFSIVPERLMKKKVACACVISEAKLNRWLLAESYSACIPAQSCCWAYFLKRTQLGWGWEAQSSFYSRGRGGETCIQLWGLPQVLGEQLLPTELRDGSVRN